MVIISNTNGARKRSTYLDLEFTNKKMKLNSEIVEMPNEIWTKIMNYLPTEDIFKSFGLVNKRFQSLISGIKYLQVKNIYGDKSNTEVVKEILKNSKALVGLEMDFLHVHTNYDNGKFRMTSENVKLNEEFIECHRLKTLKIEGCCYMHLNSIRSLKQLENVLEQGMSQKIQTNPGVKVQFTTLKKLHIKNTLEVSDVSLLSQLNELNVEHLEIGINEQIFGEFARLQFPALKVLVLRLINNVPGYEFRSLNNENSKTLMKNSPNLKIVKFQGPCISTHKRVLIKIFQEYGPITIHKIFIYHGQLRSKINSKDEIEIRCDVNKV